MKSKIKSLVGKGYIEERNESNTEELKNIILKGSIDDICNFLTGKFHHIKHTESFSFMINRLRHAEHKIKRLKEIANIAHTAMSEITLNEKQS